MPDEPADSGQLTDARQWLAAIAASSNDAIVGKNLDGIITSWNTAAAAMFGYSAEEAIGRPIMIIIPDDRLAEEAAILGRVRRGESLTRFETERKRKDGRIIPVMLTISPIRNLAGAIIGVAKTGHDLTVQREQERRLAELQAELIHVSRVNDMAHMASALAHEINQPLTAIVNYANGLRRLLAAGRTQGTGPALEQIAEQADRARSIIQRLREMIRKGETDRRRENLRTTIEEAGAMAMAGAPRDVILRITVDDAAEAALIDRIQIQQVLLNLMRNAAEAMLGSANPHLSVRAARSGPMIQISVADTGPGLDATVRARLFQPFVTTKEGGMGVGLSVCRTIVEAHGGAIDAEDAEGGGAVFRFTVPAADGTDCRLH